MTAKAKKCRFGARDSVCLGYIVWNGTMKSEKKRKTVQYKSFNH